MITEKEANTVNSIPVPVPFVLNIRAAPVQLRSYVQDSAGLQASSGSENQAVRFAVESDGRETREKAEANKPCLTKKNFRTMEARRQLSDLRRADLNRRLYDRQRHFRERDSDF